MKKKQEQIIEINDLFYKAFQASDLDLMEKVWINTEEVKCVHPGWPLISGWNDVKESWKRIFETNQVKDIVITDFFSDIQESTAWVNCVERINHEVGGNIVITMAQTTNIFEFDNSVWRMVLHHASPMPVPMSEFSSETVQ